MFNTGNTNVSTNINRMNDAMPSIVTGYNADGKKEANSNNRYVTNNKG
jgi:hypothetical protein